MNAKNIVNETPLHEAASHLHPETVRELVRLGADVTATSPPGMQAAIHRALAASPGMLDKEGAILEVVRALLDGGCPPDINTGGLIPIHLAARYEKKEGKR